jgi:hypothetical protein
VLTRSRAVPLAQKGKAGQAAAGTPVARHTRAQRKKPAKRGHAIDLRPCRHSRSRASLGPKRWRDRGEPACTTRNFFRDEVTKLGRARIELM